MMLAFRPSDALCSRHGLSSNHTRRLTSKTSSSRCSSHLGVNGLRLGGNAHVPVVFPGHVDLSGRRSNSGAARASAKSATGHTRHQCSRGPGACHIDLPSAPAVEPHPARLGAQVVDPHRPISFKSTFNHDTTAGRSRSPSGRPRGARVGRSLTA